MKLPRHTYIVLLLLCHSAGAQAKGELIEKSLNLKVPFTVLQFSTKQGLPQNQVVDIAAKKNGHLILSTANGVVEYNGTEFRSFIQNDDYKKGIIGKLYWDENTRQLFGQHTNKVLRLLYPGNKVWANCTAQLTGNTMLCIDTTGNIFRFDITDPQFRQKRVGQAKVKDAVFVYLHDQKYYIGTFKGLFVYDALQKITVKLLDGEFYEAVKDPYTRQLYFIEQHKIYRFGKTPEVFFELDNLQSKCQDIAFIENGEHYIATTEGLYAIAKGSVTLYNRKNVLSSQHIQSLYYDQTNHCLYAGTTEKGLLRLQFKNCFSYSSAQGFPENCGISAMLKTSKGELIAAGPLRAVFKVGNDTVFPYNDVKLNSACLTEWGGKMYAGTWGEGIVVMEQNKPAKTLELDKSSSTRNSVHSIFIDSKGWWWVGTGDGVRRGKSIETIKPFFDTAIRNAINCIFERSNGQICVSGMDGIYILDPQHRLIRHLGKKEGLTGKQVRCIYEDKNGKLWIGMYDGGIYCYDGGKITSINRQKNAMLDTDAFCLAPDQYGYLYITSNRGLWRIKKNDLDDFYEGKLPYLVPFYYSEVDGILNTEFNGGFQNNYIHTAQNHLLFPNIQGLVKVVPEKPVFRKLTPVIEHIFVNDSLVTALNEPLARNTSSIRFEFSNNSFLEKYNVYYQYKIERNSEKTEWSVLQRSGFVNFNSLRPGEYVFTLRAIDAFNDRSPTEISYSFEILPYFYETPWFVILLGLAFLAITIAVGRMRIQMYRRKAEEKERNKRRLAELELKAIHARMNPHFVFNSLNSIKYYLSVDDKENANRYLDGFSMLLRKFTEYSSQNFVTVREEMELIGTYVQMEQMRMNNTFESSINVDPVTLDKRIPTINIQPFVENAIKHGIAHSVKPCYLHISITAESENMVKCVIEDNGIGRIRSAEINASRQGHISSGINMVQEKNQIIEAMYSIGITIDIIDKTNELQEPTGTVVILKIPVKHD